MTMPSRIASFFTLVLIWSCQQNPSSEPDKTVDKLDKTDSVSYTINTLSSELACNSRPAEKCLDISIDQINITQGVSSEVEEKIEQDLRLAISKSDNSESASKSPQEIIDNLIQEYSQIVKDMPGYDLPWQYKSEFKVFLNQKNLFGVELHSYSFTGGAHGANFTFYSTYNTQNGKLLKLGDLFIAEQRSSFIQMAEKQFINSRDIDTNTTYEEAGYWFENEEFHLNNNFRFTPEGLEVLFNPYEIAPYSEGTISLYFSYSEIKSLLKKEFKF